MVFLINAFVVFCVCLFCLFSLLKLLQDASADEEDMKKKHPRRSYVGVKMRRQTLRERLEVLTKSTLSHEESDVLLSIATSTHFDPSSLSVIKPSRSSVYNRIDSMNSSDGRNTLTVESSSVVENLKTLRAIDNSKSVEQNEEDDWRDQLYYWTGKLIFDMNRKCLVWNGSWIGSYEGRPEAEEFSWSCNHFEYCSQQIRETSAVFDGTFLRPLSGSFRGFYMMDTNGNGSLDRYFDKEFDVQFEQVLGVYPPVHTVVGKGDSDFGAFILTGAFHAATGLLEMTRQYIANNDVMRAMDLDELKLYLVAQAQKQFAATNKCSLDASKSDGSVIDGANNLRAMSSSFAKKINKSQI